MLSKLLHNIRYDWAVHFILFLTNWFPDNVVFLHWRGFLVRPFLGSCGRNLGVGRNVVFYNPALIHIGHDVHISYGCLFLATDHIWIEDQVMFGPYCVLNSGDHTRIAGSFRFGESNLAPITIEKGAWLGAHVVVTAGVTVGHGALLAANAVATRDVSSDSLFGGVPAKAIKSLVDEK